MSFEKLLDHKCRIYHLEKKKKEIGFGLSDGEVYEYDETKETEPVKCHFGFNNSSINTTQGEPMNALQADMRLVLPEGTDIRVNDKVVSLETGYAYIAEIPRNVRGHHITVNVKRMGAAEGAL